MKRSMIKWLLAGSLVIAGGIVCPGQAAAGQLETMEYSDSAQSVSLTEISEPGKDSASLRSVSYKAGGDCGDDLKWSLDYNGNLEIYGTGDAYAGWSQYKSEIKKVTIGEGCTSIEGFSGCQNLTTVELPGTLKSLGWRAFKDCTSLTSIKLPSGLKTIADGAFSGCVSLTSIKLPEGLEQIGDGSSGASFYGSGLTSITIPKSVTSLCHMAFEKCPNLTSVTINSKNLHINHSTFKDCPKLTTVKMGSGVVSIDGSVFANCTSLQNVKFGNNLTEIGSSAFQGCTALKEISIPDKVTRLGSLEGSNSILGGYCFDGCTSLQKVTFGAGVDTIGRESFRNCTALKEIYFCGAAPYFADKIFGGCGEMNGYYPRNSKTWDRSVWTSHGAAQINWDAWTPPISHFAPNLKKIEPTGKGIKLVWQKMSDVTGYRIFRKTGNGSWKQVKEINSQSITSWTDTGLTNGTRYTWRICAIKGKSQSRVSDSLYQYYLTAEKNLKLSSKNGLLTVKWPKNKSASGYEVEYGQKKNFSGASRRTVQKASTVNTVIALSKNKTYYVRVRAYKTVNNKTSYGAWSSARKIKIK